MSDSTVNIEINGQPVEAPRGAMIIEVADRHGIRIPRFCYHKKLSVAANCRMCLVEVEKAPKPMPACATPVMEGMKVLTESPIAVRAQESVMEFLLINHPLDCPICDQGGECELQDVAMGYGRDVPRFRERKRVVQDKNLGPLIATDMTRCIHCTRCVRFGEEIGGMPELGATGRGEHLEIGTFIEGSVDSELSGNVIDLCPVGALTSKPFRFRARAWEMRQHDGVAPHDSVGSNLHVHVVHNRVMRVVPRENETVNEVWLSDRDRFSYEGLYSDDRLATPMVKEHGEWRVADWEDALGAAASALRRVVDAHGAQAFGALASAGATTEEYYLLQKLVRGLGSANVDHRLRTGDFSDQDQSPPFPWLGMPIAALEDLDAVLLVGAYPRKEHPLVNHRLRKASLAGASVFTVDPVGHTFNFRLAGRLVAGPDEMAAVLAGVAGALGASGTGVAAELIASANGLDAHHSLARTLKQGERVAILLGALVAAHPDGATLRALARLAADAAGATLGELDPGGNSAGAWLAGAVPHRLAGGRTVDAPGLDAGRMLEARLPGYLFHGIEPELDCADSASAQAALDAAEAVVMLTAYRTAAMDRFADVLLPIAPFAETPGTYVNMSGTWQHVAAAVKPFGEARPAWKLLRVLGNLLQVPGFDYVAADEVIAELGAETRAVAAQEGRWAMAREPQSLPEGAMRRIGRVPIYASDPMVRRAPALQRTRDATFAGVVVGATTAARLGLASGESVLVRQNGAERSVEVAIDERIADGCALLPCGVAQTVGLGPGFGPLYIERG